jgi:hypothetical protein
LRPKQQGNSKKVYVFYNNRFRNLRFLAEFVLLLRFLFTMYGETNSASIVLPIAGCLDGSGRISENKATWRNLANANAADSTTSAATPPSPCVAATLISVGVIKFRGVERLRPSLCDSRAHVIFFR